MKSMFDIENCQAVKIINIYLFKVELKVSLFAIENSIVFMENIKLNDIISSTSSYLLNIKNGALRLIIAKFKNTGSNIISLENSSFILSNSFFVFGKNLNSSNVETFGAIYCRDTNSIVIKNSSFFNFQNKAFGGALTYINKGNNVIHILLLMDNYFHSNVAEIGGALYLSNVGCLCARTIFKFNKANYGGSIFFNSESNFSIYFF